MAAPFSRLQLAAALLEYDNDETNPEAPNRSANDSAIFAHLRRNTVRPEVVSRKSDYLKVSIPTESSLSGRESAMSGRRSRASIDALRNPFGGDNHPEEEEDDEEEELEVDLASWGLDAFVPKDAKPSKARSKAATAPNPQPLSSVRTHFPKTNYTDGPVNPRKTARSLSVGNYDHLTLPEEDHNRRRSVGSPLELAGSIEPSQAPFHQRRSLSYAAPDSLQAQSIPFPSRSIRSPSPPLEDDDTPPRPRSVASMDSRMLLKEDTQNPASHARTLSNATMGSLTSRVLLADDNPFALRPPSRASRFDPKAAAHARTISNASLGSRLPLENEAASVMTGVRPSLQDRRYSTMELLRPKVLVMPSPLQPVTVPPPPPHPTVKDGFLLSTDGPPLPPGARSSRRSSGMSILGAPSPTGPIASNSFTPNPRMNLTLSQLTFRNTLLVGGQRDVAFSDIDRGMQRATEDGQQAYLEPENPIEDFEEPGLPMDEFSKQHRPPGKLYGKSLIDDLENRKAQMRSKQRTFKGDDRPSMMSRGVSRTSTLIDPASLQTRPVSQHMSSYGSSGSQNNLGRRNSANIKPLLQFDDDDKIAPPPISPDRRVSNNRSVFGVDTLWDREMAKLKEIEAAEKVDAERREKMAAEADAKARRKKNKKGKHTVGGEVDKEPKVDEVALGRVSSGSRLSAAPPVLPVITTIRGPPPVIEDDSESEDSGPDDAPRAVQEVKTTGWNAGSSDDEEGPRRTTGVGLRVVKNAARRPANIATDDSDEDLPLAATLGKAVQRATRLGSSEPNSDDERPLSHLIPQAKMDLPSINFDNLNRDDDDDDAPLGLRASRIGPSSHAGVDDDDQPLAFHPEQQRRTQYQMMAAQQQQQMMMQAQMQSSMFFNPAMSGFFGPPMGPPMMMQPPMQIPSPPPLHDEAKYGRVDRWRHDVAVEGE